ncbi:hypothetical protein A9Q73_06680 [Bermanella sp. 47_1433_sub80_T6]|nr:hypothetical protein A9Q73_06680 [Bermanella sp. 47_1433_sub80_T6]
MKYKIKTLIFVCVISTLAACTEQKPTTGLYLLLDTSGTYTKELKKAQQIIHYYLANLEPGDSFAVARIDSGSFSEKDIIAKVTFDHRPSRANEQKRIFAQSIQHFIETVKSSAYTDINGGLLQASEYLTETQVSRKVVMIFSDLLEELPKGFKRDFDLPLTDFEVVALNVTKLSSDNRDPKLYMKRLDYWQKRIELSGATWRVINDLEREDALIL